MKVNIFEKSTPEDPKTSGPHATDEFTQRHEAEARLKELKARRDDHIRVINKLEAEISLLESQWVGEF